jgi:thiol-disulfide isomerase/thioredoxin
MKIHSLLASVFCGLSIFMGSSATADDIQLPVWRVEIMTPGGALPFIVYGDYEGSLTAMLGSPDELKSYLVIKNGEERIRISVDSIDTNEEFFGTREARRDRWLAWHTTRVRSTTTIPFEIYGSELSWSGWGGKEIRPSSNCISEGVWKKQRGDRIFELPIAVTLLARDVNEASAERFVPILGSSSWDLDFDVDYSGRWRVEFESADEPAIGIFEVDENQIATGTFLTTTGDYRYLEGRVDGPYLRLSTFDGAHAFLFHAEMRSKDTITGDFWSGNWHHETWTAVRDDNATLPDAFEQTTVTDEQALADAVFKDIDGIPTRVLDALDETNAKARVLEIFGTWCPNCSDAGRELVSLKEKYGDDLGIVALAFEVTEDFERSSQQVQRHHAHIGSDWEILIAGLSDKAKATETLGFLDKVRSYPTLIFLNERNEVQAVYSGFSGPATGDAYTNQRERFESLIERMINE